MDCFRDDAKLLHVVQTYHNQFQKSRLGIPQLNIDTEKNKLKTPFIKKK